MKIKINSNYYVNFTDFAYERALDSIGSTFSFCCQFDNENRSIFKPLSFQKVEFFHDNNELFFTGTVIDMNFSSTSVENLVQMSGYSLPGVLEDCSISYDSYPLESNNMNLKEIITKFIKPFGIHLIIDKSVNLKINKNYSKTAASPQDSVKDYICKLAAQRNIILSHNEKGNLVAFIPDVNSKPIAFFTKENCVQMDLDVSGQDIHDKITILRQPKPKKTELKKAPKKDIEATEDELGYTVKKNPPKPKPKKIKEKPRYFDTLLNSLVGASRPIVKVLSEGEDYDTGDAAKNQLASEMKNIKIHIFLEEWQEIKPGQIVEVQNDEIYIKSKTKFIVETVKLNENSDSKTMELNLVPIEAFTGEEPKKIFE